jgi:hypothetical protein
MIYPGTYDFTDAVGRAIPRGSTFTQAFTSILIDDVALDLTGATVECEFRAKKARGGDLVETCTVVVDQGALAYDSRITISLDDTQTLTQDFQSGFWDLKVTDASNNVTYYIQGRFDFAGTVTEGL